MKELWKIIRYSRELWPYYLSVGFFTILLAGMNLLQPLFTGAIIRELQKVGTGVDVDGAKVFWLVSLVFVQDFGSTVFSNIGGYVGDVMSVKLNKLLSERYYAHLLTLPQSYYDSELTGKIVSRLNRSILQLTNFVNMIANNFLQFIFTTIFTLVVVFYFSWMVGLLLLALYPLFLWLTTRSSKKWQQYQKEKNLSQDLAFGRFQEAISQVKVVKSYVQQQRELSFFSRHISRIVKLTKPQSEYWHRQDVYRRSVLNAIFFAVYGVIAWQAVNGTLTVANAVTLILYSAQVRIPIFSMSFLVDNTQRAITDSRDYFEAMSVKPEIADNPGAKKLEVKKGEIIFNDVEFSYASDKKVIDKLTFTIAPGNKVALVGESGEGKTTITNLLLRLYDPQAGLVAIDGNNIADVTQESLRSNIAVVFQDPSLFSGTISENITYGRAGASYDEVVSAAKAANAHEFISKFEKGYETEIGERGLKLSGGQKQRIAIARALLKDAPILILDEATSSLDNKSELLVHEALERLMKGRTTIIVAHRLSTIQSVDKIVTLRNGRVSEIGSPKELAHTGGIYAQLLALQEKRNTTAAKESLKKFDIAA